MEKFYRFDRDYNFNYVQCYKDALALKKKENSYNSDETSESLVKQFLKKKQKEESNKQ